MSSELPRHTSVAQDVLNAMDKALQSVPFKEGMKQYSICEEGPYVDIHRFKMAQSIKGDSSHSLLAVMRFFNECGTCSLYSIEKSLETEQMILNKSVVELSADFQEKPKSPGARTERLKEQARWLHEEHIKGRSDGGNRAGSYEASILIDWLQLADVTLINRAGTDRF